MGRRKIEIQPITHERNRSVTFLKRKNGLFKKAYELGVLCSVDVVVIIFDEKPGQPGTQKLYEYGSSKIRDIVKKHSKYTGERDSKGPNDFSRGGGKGGGGKIDEDLDADGDEDDEDDEEEEEEQPAPPPKKRQKVSFNFIRCPSLTDL
ncbi:SRF-like protein [Marasmius fiardii PR-910]|nr:SRF-like protein [Marasmius fiardii PR-910]